MISRIKKTIFFFSFFLLFPCVTYAGSATLGISGNDKTYMGETLEVTAYISNINANTSGVVSIEAGFSYDSSCVELVSATALVGQYNDKTNKFAYLNMELNGLKSNTDLVKLTFKGKKVCSTNISFTNYELGDSGSVLNTNIVSKTINITNPPSSNDNLASLSVSAGSLNFNKNTTSYTVNVSENTSSIELIASAEDANAKVNGTGTKSLNYGDNYFNIEVTAEDNSKKTYTINVNRKDNRSGNNNLSSLEIDAFNINFNKNTISYNIDVDYSVSSIKVTAKAEDNKARVSVSGNNNLIAEEVNDVIVKVTAENGSVKTYTIHVKRGKDPNKVLSTNNNLSSIKIDAGELSPTFNKDTLNYQVNVEYTTKKISIEAKAEDTKYGVVKIEGPKNLGVGNNKFNIEVTAEDGSKKVYSVTVVRAKDPNAPLSTNTYLKEIKISNGFLTSSFNKEQYVYYYEGDIEIEAIPEDEDSKVTITKHNNIYTIMVEAPSLDIEVYTLIPKVNTSNNNISIILSIVLLIIGLIIGYLIGKKKICLKSLKLKKIDK